MESRRHQRLEVTWACVLVSLVSVAAPGLAWAQDEPSSGIDPEALEAGVPDGGLPDGGLPEGGLPEGGLLDGSVSDGSIEPLDGGVRALMRSVLDDPVVVPEVDRRNLRVGVVGNPPFHVHVAGEPPVGISVDLFRAVAARMEADYELAEYPNSEAGVSALAAGRCDLLVGPVSITSGRAARVSFTQPYWEANLAILAQPGGSLWERVSPFISRTFFGAVAILMLILTLVGTLLWIFERKPNDQFPKTPLKGIGVGIWLALVTMTTVGYGDKAPITLPGRLLTGVWMIIAMITASSLTAGIATALTLAQLDRGTVSSAEELGERRVAVLNGTTSEAFARRHRARIVEVDSIADAVDLLVAEEVDAVVYDRPVLQYYLGRHTELDLSLSDEEYEPVGYGFAAPLYSPLLRQLDVHMLALRENGQLQAISQEYF
ncbi:MAG: transporter substrate-binding domain-containing protein [Sandaracinaceae bacterium]